MLKHYLSYSNLKYLRRSLTLLISQICSCQKIKVCQLSMQATHICTNLSENEKGNEDKKANQNLKSLFCNLRANQSWLQIAFQSKLCDGTDYICNHKLKLIIINWFAEFAVSHFFTWLKLKINWCSI